MAVLDSIRKEHALIVRGLSAMEVYAAQIDEGQEGSRSDLRGFASFLTEFAELFHQEKEQDIVFPALVRLGYAWDEGPVARLREEHDQESYLVRVIDQAARQDGTPTSEDRRHLVAAIRSLVEFERRHILAEESSIYRAIQEELPEAILAELDARAHEFDHHRLPHGTLAEAMGKAEILFRRYEKLAS
jgi:hemerythrin-like domain-containing protein